MAAPTTDDAALPKPEPEPQPPPDPEPQAPEPEPEPAAPEPDPEEDVAAQMRKIVAEEKAGGGAGGGGSDDGGSAPPPYTQPKGFKLRRFMNWFPMGLTYALLYMGRYNLTVAKNSLGDLMTKEDFGLIFGAGTVVYAFAFLINGPLTDRMGGRKGMLLASSGAAVANILMGLFVYSMVTNPGGLPLPLVPALSVLYAMNMYFQSFGAVSIVKVNAHWFHITERGGFSGIFGTMISSGIFFAFTVNAWVLDGLKSVTAADAPTPSWWVFFLPAGLLAIFFVVEFFLLRDSPGKAGFKDFDTGDADSGKDSGKPIPTLQLIKRILTHPVIIVVALIEFCTGVLRNGVMHWFPFYTKEVWALPSDHWLRNGSWASWEYIVGFFMLAVILFSWAARSKGKRRASLIIAGALCALAPFLQAGWGGILFVAGVIGANVAGWVSDLFFQSRRAPAAGGLYLLLAICAVVMIFVLGGTTTVVGWVKGGVRLRAGDKVLSVAGKTGLDDWSDVARAYACVPSRCEGEDVVWDLKRCMCTSKPEEKGTNLVYSRGTIPLTIERAGARLRIDLKDPLSTARAGDKRVLPAGPDLTLTPFLLGLVVFVISIAVIGTHGLLSGTATMDFGGRQGAAMAVGMIDGFVYLGTAVQSISLGFLTSRNWVFWPLFLLPFAILGFILLTRIWHAKPGRAAH